jgi:hypothetical protein
MGVFIDTRWTLHHDDMYLKSKNIAVDKLYVNGSNGTENRTDIAF